MFKRNVMSSSDLIVLDADGVLLDYRVGYGRAWENAFGTKPQVRDEQAYHAKDYWDVADLSPAEYAYFAVNGFTSEIWSSMPAMPGALVACESLQARGFRLVCATALAPQHLAARKANLATLGFKFEAVHAVGPARLPHTNPKKALLRALHPAAFVDDYLGYLQGLRSGTWRALIDVHPHKSPNHNPCYTAPNARYDSLLNFTQQWLKKYPDAA